MADEEKCGGYVQFRYTWAGKAETHVCFLHAMQAQNIANAMGYPLQIIDVEIDPERFCEQKPIPQPKQERQE